MNEKQKDELLKHVVGAIGAIKAQFEVEVIKDYEIPPLVNTKTMQDIGFGVKLQLNTRYDYDEEMLTQWKNMLKADEWYISVKRNQLHVTFKVRYKEDGGRRCVQGSCVAHTSPPRARRRPADSISLVRQASSALVVWRDNPQPTRNVGRLCSKGHRLQETTEDVPEVRTMRLLHGLCKDRRHERPLRRLCQHWHE